MMSGAANVLETPVAQVRDQIVRACAEARRDPASVTLVAISKTFGADAIEPVIAAGQRVFGENRVQEAKAKWPPLKQRHSGIEIHLVGSLQSNKPQKAGVLPEETDAFVKACRERHGLSIAGLMCLPPAHEPPAPHFALTAKIARRNGLSLLSMGMSADFPLAIEFGATHVRVGTAIFGERASRGESQA